MKHRILLSILALGVLGLAGCTTSDEKNGVSIEQRHSFWSVFGF